MTLVEMLHAQVERLRRASRGRSPTTHRLDWSSSEGQAVLALGLRRAGIPDIYASADWDRVRIADLMTPFREKIRERTLSGKGLLIMGPTGTGKSSLAGLMAREALMAELSVRWSYVPDLIGMLRDPYRREEEIRSQKIPDLLVWDDFAVGGLQPFEIGLLDRIVEGRYSRRRAMIITTNLSKQALQDPALARMVDRWREQNRGVSITGESMRATG